MSNVRQVLARSAPIPCNGCGADVWHAHMGACERCFLERWVVFAAAMGWEVELSGRQAAVLFPVPGGRVKCGLRDDLPRKERRHSWVSLGADARNHGTAGFRDAEIRACVTCGTDQKR